MLCHWMAFDHGNVVTRKNQMMMLSEAIPLHVYCVNSCFAPSLCNHCITKPIVIPFCLLYSVSHSRHQQTSSSSPNQLPWTKSSCSLSHLRWPSFSLELLLYSSSNLLQDYMLAEIAEETSKVQLVHYLKAQMRKAYQYQPHSKKTQYQNNHLQRHGS